MSMRVQIKTVAMALALASVAISGCKKGGAPTLQDIGDQEALVGETLTLNLFASDPDGDDLSFSFRADGLEDKDATTSLAEAAGHAVFTFTPLASQIGTQFFDFIVTDGRNSDELNIRIDVKGAVGSGTLPIFRKPLGSGTVLDLEQAECVEFEIEVEDPDSTQVALTQEPPIIDDSNLATAGNGLTGTWSWCPTREQRETNDRYDLVLSAADADNPPVLKDYIVVLRKRSGEGCPGEFPVIEHETRDHNTLLDLDVTARVTDDQGLKDAPLLCYSYEHPGDPVDFTKMTLLEMSLVSGDMMDGQWQQFIPNPTAEQVGASAPVFYLFSANDDDDAEGDCDHLQDLPEDGVFEVTVTNDGSGGAGVCEPCSFDVQCGDDGDLCVATPDGGFCGKGCSGGDCGGDTICSPSAVQSVDGAAARQCIPNSGSCTGGGGNCSDDSHEDDDSPAEAAAQGTVSEGNQSGTLCPSDDDWWQISTSEEAEITVTLSGDAPPDIDVAITDSDGVLIQQSAGLTSDEELTTACLDGGTYYLRVFSIGSGNEPGDYTVGYSADAGSCGNVMGTGDCCEDNNTPGCEDAAIQSCVCAIDDFCCDFEWDDTCGGIATDDCGADCGSNEGCCTAQTTPGCTDSAIEQCVCSFDPWCCGMDTFMNGVWDSFCTGKVWSCGDDCDPDDADGRCCEANGTAGCENNTVEACVCAEDSFCCDNFWDAGCADAVEMHNCGNCPLL